MKVIAIIVTYNGMKWYKDCFDSLRNSSIPIQTIVIDNASSDNTVDYIKENYPEIHLVESKENLGFGKANNLGFKYAIEQNADFIFLLNQDAWVDKNTIEELANTFKKNSEYGILSPIHLTKDRSKLDLFFSSYLTPDLCPDIVSDYILEQKIKKDVYSTSFVNAAMWLISKDCLSIVGGFDSLFPHYGEDNNYIHRAYYHQYLTGIVPIVYGVHDRENRSNNKITFKQKKSREFIRLLIILLNINLTLSTNIRVFLTQTCSNCFKSLFDLSLTDLAISTLVFFKICFQLPSIIKHRKINKQRGLSYLE